MADIPVWVWVPLSVVVCGFGLFLLCWAADRWGGGDDE